MAPQDAVPKEAAEGVPFILTVAAIVAGSATGAALIGGVIGAFVGAGIAVAVTTAASKLWPQPKSIAGKAMNYAIVITLVIFMLIVAGAMREIGRPHARADSARPASTGPSQIDSNRDRREAGTATAARTDDTDFIDPSIPIASNPYAQYAQPDPAAHVDPAWVADINAWEQRHADFLSDPWHRETMDAALGIVDTNTPGLPNLDLIREAERMAFKHTGWSRAVAASTPRRQPAASNVQAPRAPTSAAHPPAAGRAPDSTSRIMDAPTPIGGTPHRPPRWSDFRASVTDQATEVPSPKAQASE